MRSVRQDVATYATCDYPVLILGESGTGKDLAAKEIHRASNRAAGPFEVRNMGALPEGLVESELFGCEAGAFTDARSRPGCFEEANGGTLFLDEIGDAGPVAQAALLRIVEDGEVRRLGGSRRRFFDCRIICATNRDLTQLVPSAVSGMTYVFV
jgi:two-component system response regulator AtoC